MSRLQPVLLSMLFVAALFVPAAGFFRPAAVAAFYENRTLASLPPWPTTLAQWRQWPAAMDRYAADQFGFRARLLEGQRRVVSRGWNESLSADVIVGRDGWLYYAAVGGLAEMLGHDTMTPASREHWANYFAARGALLAARGIAYAASIIPDKHIVFPEHLPAGLPTRAPGRLRLLEQSLPDTARRHYVSLLEALLAARDAPQLYLKSDSHWSMYGAYVAYQELVRVRGAELGLRDWGYTASDFPLADSGSLTGDLANVSGIATSDAQMTLPTIPGQCYLPLDATVTATMARVGSQVTQVIVCDGSGTALILHDSYMARQIGYIAPNYRTVWLAANTSDLAALLDALQPDVVIEQRVERALTGTPVIDPPPR